jgi:hypothetical protein
MFGLLYFLCMRKKDKAPSSSYSFSHTHPVLHSANSSGSKPISFRHGSYESASSILNQQASVLQLDPDPAAAAALCLHFPAMASDITCICNALSYADRCSMDMYALATK